MIGKGVTYQKSGVDIEKADEAVRRISKDMLDTHRYLYPSGCQMLTSVGGFAALIKLPGGIVLALTTDGVGTKLMIAILLDQPETVGIDLVAMCVNDILVYNVDPQFFLDYIAMGKQYPDVTERILGGVIEGCNQARIALVGGEMAEMPGLYPKKIFDLAGFAGGIASSEDMLIRGFTIRPGMNVYGIASSGIHANGFSLIRKIYGIHLNNKKKSLQVLNEYHNILRKTLGEELLTPTTIYTKKVGSLCMRYDIHGMANITGGGLVDNPPRILHPGRGLAIEIWWGSWRLPMIYHMIARDGNIPPSELRKALNCGIGYVLISPDKIQEDDVYLIGKIIEGDGSVHFRVK